MLPGADSFPPPPDRPGPVPGGAGPIAHRAPGGVAPAAAPGAPAALATAGDAAPVAAAVAADLATLAVVEGELGAVDTTLARIDAGTYGTCEGCGRAVGEDRLAARPLSARCVSCDEASPPAI
jgi:hypothetical protein